MLAFDSHFARRRPLQSSHDVQQRAFTATGRSHETHELAAPDLKIRHPDRLDGAAGIAGRILEDLADLFNLNQLLHVALHRLRRFSIPFMPALIDIVRMKTNRMAASILAI